MGFFDIGPGELILILLIALMVFGPGKIPEFARGLGRAVRELRKYSSALTKDFRDEFEKELRADSRAPKEGTSEDEKTEGEPDAISNQTDGISRQDDEKY